MRVERCVEPGVVSLSYIAEGRTRLAAFSARWLLLAPSDSSRQLEARDVLIAVVVALLVVLSFAVNATASTASRVRVSEIEALGHHAPMML